MKKNAPLPTDPDSFGPGKRQGTGRVDEAFYLLGTQFSTTASCSTSGSDDETAHTQVVQSWENKKRSKSSYKFIILYLFIIIIILLLLLLELTDGNDGGAASALVRASPEASLEESPAAMTTAAASPGEKFKFLNRYN